MNRSSSALGALSLLATALLAACTGVNGSPSSGGAGAQTTRPVTRDGSSARCPTATWERPPACDAAECSCDSVCADGAGQCGAATLMATCGTTCRGTYTAWVPSPPSCDADADCVPRCMGWVCKNHECRRPDGGCTNDAQCSCGTFCVIGGGYCVAAGRLAP